MVTLNPAIAALVTIVPAPMVCSGACSRVACTGQQMLAAPRPESSCQTVKPQIYPSPDGAVRALVYPTDADLHVTPDMESRVVFRGTDGTLLTSKDYASPRGTNGYYVVRAQWSPDSHFFVFSMSSSGGHSPWSFPTWVFSRDKGIIADFSTFIGGNPTLSADFSFVGPHTIKATTVEKPGSQTQVPVTVDLSSAIAQAPVPAE